MASTRPFLSTFQTRLLAYELGSISRSKIEREASRTAPQLHRLVGHAAVFDNTTKFILDHIDDTCIGLNQLGPAMIEEIPDPEDSGCIDTAGLKNHDEPKLRTTEVSFDITHHASLDGYAQWKAKDDCAVVVTTTLVNADDNNGEHTQDESSNESREDDESFDEDSWNDSRGNGDGGKENSDWGLLDAFAAQVKHSSLVHHPRDDNLLLCAEQPRVLSTKTS